MLSISMESIHQYQNLINQEIILYNYHKIPQFFTVNFPQSYSLYQSYANWKFSCL